MRLRRQRRNEPEVNLTPLIDVVFLLLIFFMVSTTFQRETEITVELPEAGGEQLKSEPQVVEITIDAEGRYYVNQREVVNRKLETLQRALQKVGEGEETEKPQVIINADRRTPHESVIRAMDAARRLGYYQITFATRRSEE